MANQSTVVVVVDDFGESMAVEILVWRNFCCTLGMLPWKNWRLLGQNLEDCFGKIHISTKWTLDTRATKP